MHKREITGFTAAEIWAAAAVEMAIVAGMYVIGILATILILLVQIIFTNNIVGFPQYGRAG